MSGPARNWTSFTATVAAGEVGEHPAGLLAHPGRANAGQIRARRPAAVTAELASVFRSAIDRAGLTFAVDCPPLDQPVYVDREIWEKVMLNLLSNALKFTFDGSITVRVGREDTEPCGSHRHRHRDRNTCRGDASALRTLPSHRNFARPVHGGQRNRAGSGQRTRRITRWHHHCRQPGGRRAQHSPSGCRSVRPICPPTKWRPRRQRAPISGVTAEPYVQEALRWLPADARPHTAGRSTTATIAVSPRRGRVAS